MPRPALMTFLALQDTSRSSRSSQGVISKLGTQVKWGRVTGGYKQLPGKWYAIAFSVETDGARQYFWYCTRLQISTSNLDLMKLKPIAYWLPIDNAYIMCSTRKTTTCAKWLQNQCVILVIQTLFSFLNQRKCTYMLAWAPPCLFHQVKLADNKIALVLEIVSNFRLSVSITRS